MARLRREVSKTRKVLNQMANVLGVLESKFCSLLEYFGEDPSFVSEEFFSLLKTFLGVYTESVQKYKREQKRRERAAQREAKAQKRAPADVPE